MGASGWSYFVPYQTNMQQAFVELQQHVFKMQLYEPLPEALQRLAPFHTVADLLNAVGAAGTHSILDVPPPDSFQACSPTTLDALFQTQKPTHAMIEAAEQGGELWSRADGDYSIVHTNTQPHEIYFIGATGD